MLINRVIIIGHTFKPNESTTHTFIHQAYDKAFRHLGYETYWVDNIFELDITDFSGTLFFLEGGIFNLPLRDDCYYVLHHVNNKPFVEKGCKFVNLCNFLLDPLSRNESYNYPLDGSGQHGKNPLYTAEKIKDWVYYDVKNKAIYQPWATNLLPDEIIENPLEYVDNLTELNFIGSIWSENINQIIPMIFDLMDNNINFNIYGWLEYDFFSNHTLIKHLSNCGLPEENSPSLVRSSVFYPDIRGQHHINLGYIPCRIFKNISYGCIPITNSKLVYEFFEGDILYSSNTADFLRMCKSYFNNRNINKDKRTIRNVKQNHTYINRVIDLLDFINVLY